ncbi:MAG: class I poly(R)-hydroxyalkanoic acid synthase [Thermodesulfobacteriota bacterium]
MPDRNTTATQQPDMKKLTEILAEVNAKSRNLVQKFLQKKENAREIDQTEVQVIASSFQDLAARLAADPTRLFNAQMSYWNDYWQLIRSSAFHFLGRKPEKTAASAGADKRFRHEAWDENPMFHFIKQSYLLSARAIRNTVQNVQGLDAKTRQRVEFYTNQYLDAVSPSNFIATNPELMQLTLASRGENLLKGLNNFLEDLDRSPCQLQIRMTDMNAFEVGKNVAVTPGKIVHQNDLIQLIQYQPATKQVFQRPLLFIPPWINKYYILDLTEKNSMVKWMVDQGYTVFMISWANPDETLKNKDFEDYMAEGPIAALEAIEGITGQRGVNCIGYCMGGTLLACATAYLQARGEGDRITSNTYMASLLDFSIPGDIGVFIDEAQIDAFERKMDSQGYLDGCAMSNSFSMLRANDLVWSYVINNYLKGEAPIAFDILFWNSDATNMPARMHSFYLRNMYLHNRLRVPGALVLKETPIDLSRITIPVYFISTREDHIAMWQATYAGTKLHNGPVRFVLGASGHVAGIVNPPPRIKYGHWTNPGLPDSAGDWLAGATYHEASWWLDWLAWNQPHAGGLIPAREVGKDSPTTLEDAPGCYVTKRLDLPESGVCYLPNALL